MGRGGAGRGGIGATGRGGAGVIDTGRGGGGVAAAVGTAPPSRASRAAFNCSAMVPPAGAEVFGEVGRGGPGGVGRAGGVVTGNEGRGGGGAGATLMAGGGGRGAGGVGA